MTFSQLFYVKDEGQLFVMLVIALVCVVVGGIYAMISNFLHKASSTPAPLKSYDESFSGPLYTQDLDTFYNSHAFHLNPLPRGGNRNVLYTPPKGIDTLMACYLYNNYKYTDKIIYVLIVDLITRGLVDFHYSMSRGCYILETLKPSDAFYTMQPMERDAAFILLGGRFNAGRLYTFDGINNTFLYKLREFLTVNLNRYAGKYGSYARESALAFRNYLDVGERLRMPIANKENEALLFVSKNIKYLAFALAFDLDNDWGKFVGSTAKKAVFEDLRKGFFASPAVAKDMLNKSF